MGKKKINKGRRTEEEEEDGRRTRWGEQDGGGGRRARPFSKSGQNKKEKNPNSH